MKIITIAYRTPDGWHYMDMAKGFPVNHSLCNRCGAKLFQAPHGMIYCDAVHEELETNEIK